jgi:hypothetical protein
MIFLRFWMVFGGILTFPGAEASPRRFMVPGRPVRAFRPGHKILPAHGIRPYNNLL